MKEDGSMTKSAMEPEHNFEKVYESYILSDAPIPMYRPSDG